jgi:AraC-like DNA-binding protein
MDLGTSLVLAGSANALLLSFLSALNGRRNPAAGWLCALFALFSVVCTAILAAHRMEGTGERFAVAIEHTAAIAIGPTVYHYIAVAIGAPIALRRLLLHYVPCMLYLLIGAPLNIAGAAEPPPPAVVVAYVALYTAASGVLFARYWSRFGFSERLTWPAAVLASMLVIHLGQVARFASANQILQNIVPVSGAIAVFALMVLALHGSRPWMLAAVRYARSSVDKEQLRSNFDLLREILQKQQLFRRADLKLADLANAAGISSHLASQTFSQAGGITFHQILSECRVTEAKKLLAQPENAEVAVEPLGMEAGFRSRSSFYSAFQKATGQTPAEYRRHLNG